MAIKEKDFVEIEYTGRFAEDKIVFDTSDETKAKAAGIHNKDMKYGPVIICIGEHQVISGLDKNLVGKEAGKDYTFSILAEEGFGKKDAKLLILVPLSAFKKQNINVMPGLQVEIDGRVGTIKTVTGGRVIVDFNHPFSGKDLVYDVKVIRMVEDKAEQISSMIRLLLNMQPEITLAADSASITLPQKLPEVLEKELEKKLVELTGLKSISFGAKAEEKKALKAEEPEKESTPEQK